MKTALRLALCILLLLPALANGQTTPVNTAGFTISTARPMTRTEYLTILSDSLDQMEARLLDALSDSANAAVAQALGDSVEAMEARLTALIQAQIDTSAVGAIDDARVDSTLYIWVTAGDTTSPGCFYAPDTATGKFVRADSSLLRRARIVGVAVDSVNKDGVVRLQTSGTVSFAWWNGLLGPVGSTVVNDSITACNPAPADASRTNTLPMQALGTVLDSITVRLNIGEVWYYEN